jgi:adenylosuccinate synthase
VIVVGLGWGDEGKGKIVDLLASGAGLVARFSGGANAGHTVTAGGRTLVLHQIPSGILHPSVTGLIGSGCVVDPAALLEEYTALEALGISPEGRLLVSPRAHLVHPAYRIFEELEERARGDGAIGTTGRGIGPAYARKYARTGIRLEDARDGMLATLSAEVSSDAEAALGAPLPEDVRERTKGFEEASARLCGLCGDVAGTVAEALGRGRTVLAEGAQGTLLDPDHGTYPYVTSGPCVAPNAFVSLGIGLRPASVLGVMKAYSTRVGAGPFPTELDDETGERLRVRGREYGSTTGRPRRCGWLDAVLMRYSVAVNGCTSLALTLLDVLGGFPQIRVCTAYADGAHLPPPLGRGLARCVPVYQTLPGWSADISGERRWEALPPEARRYVEFLESFCGAPVELVSTGPAREDVIRRPA